MGLDDARAALERIKEAGGGDGLKAIIRDLQDKLDAERRKNVELAARLPSRHALEPRTHLVIGDPHSDPLWPNDRFTWLGRAIADINPDVVICMGDFATLGSLGKYDRGKLSGEGQRLNNDISACRDALARINAECRGHPAPKVMIGGNHENRIDSYTSDRPELAGTLSIESLGFAEFGWEYIPFLTPYKFDGITYVHYLVNKMGRAISGKYLGANLLAQWTESIVVGHDHTLNQYIDHRARKLGLSAGCYFSHEEKYATPVNNSAWYRGLVKLTNVLDGYGTVEPIPIEEIKRRFS